jgi:GNAT superfamily N-acetyltransferase
MHPSIKSLHGADIEPYIEDVARLRIEVFHAFPYLYEGSMEYEREYLQTFARSKNNILVLAFDGDAVVGASTGLPLEEEPANIQAPFLARGYDVGNVFYFSESVLKSAYRGRGIGVEFFRLREYRARQLGRFNLLAFCAVVRPDDHPLRPADYRPLDHFWQQRGFNPTDMYCFIDWQDRDEAHETAKPLRFWVKSIEEE